MIKKIICWIFGHIIREKIITEISGDWTETYYWKWNDKCPRCGSNIA